MLQFLGSQTLTSITLVSLIVELIWQTFVLYPFSGAELFIKKQRYSKSKTSLNGSFSTGLRPFFPVHRPRKCIEGPLVLEFLGIG